MRSYFLETNRIGFSHWNKGDFALAKELWGDSLVTKYICASGVFSEEDIKKRLRLEISNEATYQVQYWPIFQKETEQFLGCCGLRPYDLKRGIYEIGFHLISTCWGNGYGQEAAKEVISYAMDTLQAINIFAGHHPQNQSSKKLLECLGFTYTGVEYYPPTALITRLIYSRIGNNSVRVLSVTKYF